MPLLKKVRFFHFQVVDEEAERECENARHFTNTLCALLPSLLAIRSTIEVDEAMLEFASKYCEGKILFVYRLISQWKRFNKDKRCIVLINWS